MRVTLHHLAAISGNLQRTIAFYHSVLGFKYSIKKSRAGGPKVCSFYWQDTQEQFIIFYECPGLRKSSANVNGVRSIGFLVDARAIQFWENRLRQLKIEYRLIIDELEDSRAFSFFDPDGLPLKLVFNSFVSRNEDCGNIAGSIYRLRRIHNIEIISIHNEILKNLFVDRFRMASIKRTASLNRFVSLESPSAVIDVYLGGEKAAVPAGYGLIHHLALEIHEGKDFLRLCNCLKKRERTIFSKKRDGYFSMYFWINDILFEIVRKRPKKPKGEVWEFCHRNQSCQDK